MRVKRPGRLEHSLGGMKHGWYDGKKQDSAEVEHDFEDDMSSQASLVPGYIHVDNFGPDDGYESDEEITYVTLDLGAIEPTLLPSSSTYRLIVSHPSGVILLPKH